MHSTIALTGPVLSARMLSVPSLAQITAHYSAGCSRCALTLILSPIPMATVAGHLTMPSLIWRVVSFIRNYAALHALPDPGRLQGTIRDYVLESGKTLKSVYAEYSKAMESISMTTPAPQQPCPYRLTSGLKQQYT